MFGKRIAQESERSDRAAALAVPNVELSMLEYVVFAMLKHVVAATEIGFVREYGRNGSERESGS